MSGDLPRTDYEPNTKGRWPANVILDESQAAELDKQSGSSTSRVGKPRGTIKKGLFANSEFNKVGTEHNDTGGASRFFYVAKAGKTERPNVDGVAHPTVKPLALMRYLVRLVTPPGGVVLEPFAGSGATVEACLLEGFRCVAVEREAEYLPLIRARVVGFGGQGMLL
jgi:site-specific DNA-methyltransferase (adenine-specific)